MRTFTILFFTMVLLGCATTPRDTHIRAVAVETFGGDAHLKIHEVIYAGPVSSTLSGLGTGDELALWSDMKPGATRDVDLVVWSYSSAKAASVLSRACRYVGTQRLPHLRLLFVGDAQDVDRVRSLIEATGAQFYFHQK